MQTSHMSEFLANKLAQAESLLHQLYQTAEGMNSSFTQMKQGVGSFKKKKPSSL